MNTDVLKLVQGTEDSLSKAVSAVLGHPVTMRLSVGTRPDGTEYLDAHSDPLPLTGPAYFMFTVIKVCSFGSIRLSKADCAVVASFDLHFDYHHHHGGHNGCQACVCGQRIVLVCEYAHEYGYGTLSWRAVVQ